MNQPAGNAGRVPGADSLSCSSCGTKGRKVGAVTVRSLLTDDAGARAGSGEGFRFCANPDCPVAYFHPNGSHRFERSDVRVPIFQKDAAPTRPVCYCFDHSVQEIEDEVATTGSSVVPGEIVAGCKQGLDRCEELNPQGSCCLGNVRAVVKQAQASTTIAENSEMQGCCAPDTKPNDDPIEPSAGTGTAPTLASAGAVIAAALSSACCWLPLLLLGAGASAAGVAGFFEAYRLPLLVGTGLLIATGFYLVYVRKPACMPDGSCAAPSSRLRRIDEITLWMAIAAAIVFASFPDYVGHLLGSEPNQAIAATAPMEHVILRIAGMTCAGCAIHVEQALAAVDGVARVEVSYDDKTARVLFDPGAKHPDINALRDALRVVGYSASPALQPYSKRGL